MAVEDIFYGGRRYLLLACKYYFSGRAMLLGEHGIRLLLSSQRIGNDYRHIPSVRYLRCTHSLNFIVL